MNLLIKPASFRMLGTTPPPLGLLYLAATTKNTQVWDAAIHGDPKQIMSTTYPKVVGAQVYTTSRHESLNILKYAKGIGAVTVAGGPHASAMYKQLESFDYIDFIVSGDGEYPWKKIVAFADGYGPRPERVQRELVQHLDKLPLPAWDKIDINDYAPNRINIVLGRGCDGQCTFCSAWWVVGKYRHHGWRWLSEELAILGGRGVKHLVFQDDCLTCSFSATQSLLRALSYTRYKFRWTGTTRVDKLDRTTIRDLKAAGCYQLGFGIESGSQTILDRINKQADLEQALRVRQWCKQEGVGFKALMMSGFPFETEETRKEDAAFRKRLAPDEWGSVGHIMVLPGTKLYRDLKKEGKIDDDYWLGDEPYYRLG